MIGRDEVLRVFTAFSGYDSQCMALDRIGVNYELVGWSEIDPNAIAAHNAVYPQWADRNAGDISKIDWGGQISTAITTRYGARQTDTMYRVPSDTEEAKRKP